MEKKVCRDCGVAKLLIEFHPRPLSRSRDGRDSYCIYCHRARCRVSYQQAKELRKAERALRADEIKQYNANYIAANREKLLEVNREYHKAHRPEMATRKRVWRTGSTSV